MVLTQIVLPLVPRGSLAFPCDLIEKIARAKYFVESKPYVPTHTPITMHVDAAILRQQIAHQHQPLVDHSYEGVSALAPRVAICNLFQDARLLGEGLVADLDVH